MRRKQAGHRLELVLFCLLTVVLTATFGYQFWLFYQNLQGTTVGQRAQQEQEEQILILTPSAIYISSGSNLSESYGRLDREDELFTTVFEAGYALLRRCLAEGTTQKVSAEDFPWDQTACVFVYDYIVEAELLAEVGERDLEDPAENGTEIWIVPSESVRDTVTIYLVNWESGELWRTELSANQSTENQNLRTAMTKAEGSLQKNWVCVRRSFGDSVNSNVFIRPQDKTYKLEKNYIGNPLETTAEKWNQNKAHQYARTMLADPDSMVCLIDSETKLLYSYEGASLSIEREGLIQYMQVSEGSDSKASGGIASDYQIAWSFLCDHLAPNLSTEMELRLTGYQAEENGHTFYFSYYYLSTRLLESEESLRENAMQASVEIYVENGSLRSCRLLPLEVRRRSQEVVALDESWIEAVDRIWTENRGVVPLLCISIEDGTCQYVWTTPGESMEAESES